ncbi:ATP-binding cassette domain-containing protein [Microbacterium sp. MPKO10]|uniref:ATP-binding cassette domain-containing protein n=1 Tax=Microbacterium sp. MPKO10 TaxID=2989818 RepID=UPI002235D2B6|nr:ATP-binding cassette domain-containing protein [Microbacterium sp. MPKO10]MCW4459847.1 ATP-binding cassette domain-containing protein [Microbacterium sp. MPKO10]
MDTVSFDIERGRTFGLVGESGSGKSTIGRAVLRLIELTSGEVRINGTNIGRLSTRELRRARQEMQMVFQDPYSSLNPRVRVGSTIREAMRICGKTRTSGHNGELNELLLKVGLTPEFANRYPHELSGGQLQRIAIARAMSVSPSLVVLDEPTSALDVSVQKGILKLLTDIQIEHNVSYLFISHDIAVVRAMSDVIGVMKAGKLVETGAAEQVLDNPQHEYTKELLTAVPKLPGESAALAFSAPE